jgi:toxin ParE1/3/4
MIYTLSKRAEKDIEEMIESSFLQFGTAQTEKYKQGLEQCFNFLSGDPKIGISVEHLREGYRKFPHQSHVIYYKIRKRGIFIVRVLHERMSEQKHL